MTLAQVYGNDLPNRDELIWEYVGLNDFIEVDFPIVDINPIEVFNRWDSGKGRTCKMDFDEFATYDQKRMVRDYRKQLTRSPQKSDLGIIVIDLISRRVVDGFHRIAAMALEGVTTTKALDISGG